MSLMALKSCVFFFFVGGVVGGREGGVGVGQEFKHNFELKYV